MSPLSYERTKRLFDIGLSTVALAGLSLPLAAIAVAVRTTSPGPIIHWSRRIGKDNREFRMPKFRTMRIDAPQVATHLLTDPDRYVTRVGRLLRRTSMDELPQLFTILRGDMSFVGPRPALFNQDDLISLRTEKGVYKLVPGLTGWAQINGRDELPIPIKVDFDVEYLRRRSLRLDLEIVLRTALKAVTGSGVAH
jgi:O-antigen biosynthesis protein WbqP